MNDVQGLADTAISLIGDEERRSRLHEQCFEGLRLGRGSSSHLGFVRAVMAEEDDEWAITRRYLSLESLSQARPRALDPSDQKK